MMDLIKLKDKRFYPVMVSVINDLVFAETYDTAEVL